MVLSILQVKVWQRMEKLGRPSLSQAITDELNARELVLSILRTAIRAF